MSWRSRSKTTWPFLAAAVAVTCASALGCEAPSVSGPPELGEQDVDERAPMAAGAAEPAVLAQRPPGGREIGDPEVLGFVRVAQRTGADAARLASNRATSARLQELAREMAADNARARQRVEDRMRELRPAETEWSRELSERARENLERLRAESNRTFDRAYIDAQIDRQRQLLDTIDRRLLPAARTAEVEKTLRELRREIVDHLDRVEDLRRELDRDRELRPNG